MFLHFQRKTFNVKVFMGNKWLGSFLSVEQIRIASFSLLTLERVSLFQITEKLFFILKIYCHFSHKSKRSLPKEPVVLINSAECIRFPFSLLWKALWGLDTRLSHLRIFGVWQFLAQCRCSGYKFWMDLSLFFILVYLSVLYRVVKTLHFGFFSQCMKPWEKVLWSNF